jgi:uncharacterized protein (UPF0335 family)
MGDMLHLTKHIQQAWAFAQGHGFAGRCVRCVRCVRAQRGRERQTLKPLCSFYALTIKMLRNLLTYNGKGSILVRNINVERG